MTFAWWAVSNTLVMFAVTACGPAQPALHPVAGLLVFQGRPLAGFAVEFSSTAEATKGVSAVGVADSAGRFTLETRQAGKQRPGAVAGSHTVVVLPPPPFGSEGKPIEPVPIKYASHSQSGLTAEVVADHPNDIRLELEP